MYIKLRKVFVHTLLNHPVMLYRFIFLKLLEKPCISIVYITMPKQMCMPLYVRLSVAMNSELIIIEKAYESLVFNKS